MIRGQNLTGDYAEYIVKQYFENIVKTELQLEKQSNKGFDLVVNNEKYQIKGITGTETSKFSDIDSKKRPFDYVIIVKFDTQFKVKNMYKLNWDQFESCKKTSKNKVYLKIDNLLINNSVDLMAKQ
jgi:hypothetical protein